MFYKMKFILVLSLIVLSSNVVAQNDINQFDINNERHGDWKKTFQGTKQLRYEGTFKHGKEVGVFKYYCSDCDDNPTIIKTFNDTNNIAQVQYFTKRGKLVSEGKMEDKSRMGEWVYYHKKSNGVMTKEFYIDGKLEGLIVTYYTNNKVTEETEYKNGIKEGINNYYSPQGVLLKKLHNKNDQLNGPATYYDAYGNIVIIGQYKNGKKHGPWKYYKNQEVILEETYPKSYKKKGN